MIRLILGVAFAYAAYTVAGLWAWITGVAALIMFGTAAIGFCPLYVLFGISTCPVRTQGQR